MQRLTELFFNSDLVFNSSIDKVSLSIVIICDIPIQTFHHEIVIIMVYAH